LVVYPPGREPQWFGPRIFNVTEWSGPGALRDWVFYHGNTLLALDPQTTYLFDRSVSLPQDRFHVTDIPGEFALHADDARRIRHQDVGEDGSYYKLSFVGSGPMKMFVPDDVLVFLDGQEVAVNRESDSATAVIASTPERPSVLLAYPRSDTELAGSWSALPWQTPPNQHGYVVAQGDGFFNHVAGAGLIVGRFPDAPGIRLRGRWGMSGRPKSTGDAVVRINGREVMRVPPGPEPYEIQAFDVDISAFAGRDALLEFAVDGEVHGPSPANWYQPTIVVERPSGQSRAATE
jgi:hypothetical protein